MVDVPDAINASADRVARTMTPDLRSTALDSGWPHEVVQRLSVVNSGGILTAGYDGDRSEMEDLEYGTPGAAPKPAINNFFGSHDVRKKIREETSGSMVEVLRMVDRLFA